MQRYDEVAAPANFWDIQPKFVTNGVINGKFVTNGAYHTDARFSFGIEFVYQAQRFVAGLHLVHLLQVRHDRLVAHAVTADAVHVETMERTNLLTVRTLWQILLLGVGQDELVDASVVQFIQVGERPVLRVLCVQRGCPQPSTNGVLPEVITRFYTRVPC